MQTGLKAETCIVQKLLWETTVAEIIVICCEYMFQTCTNRIKIKTKMKKDRLS